MNNLQKLPNWSPQTARELAAQRDVQLGDEHIEILIAARNFFDSYGFSPSMRPLCKTVAEQLDLNKGRSVYLLQLFPGSPATEIARLAGLPAPKNCL